MTIPDQSEEPMSNTRLTVTLSNVTHRLESPENPRMGPENVLGQAEFSDGKRYRFRFARLQTKPGKNNPSAPAPDYHVTAWAKHGPDQDPRSDERVVALGAERVALIAEAARKALPEAREEARQRAETQDRERRLYDSRALAHHLHLAVGPQAVTAARRAIPTLTTAAERCDKAGLTDTGAQLRAQVRELQQIVNRASGMEPQTAFMVRRKDQDHEWSKWTMAWSAQEAAAAFAFEQGSGKYLPEEFEAQPDPSYRPGS